MKQNGHHHRLDLVRTLLPTVSSVSTFSCTDIMAFRQSLRKILRIAVEESKDCRILEDNIVWKDLIRHHDNRRRDVSYSSPFQELMSVFLDPTIMPMAYSGNLCAVLLRILLAHGSTKSVGKASTKLMLETFQTIRQRVPTFMLEEPMIQIVQTMAVERLHIVANTLSAIVNDDLWFGTLVIRLLLVIVQIIDNSDIKALLEKKALLDDLCWECQRPMILDVNYPKHRRGKVLATLKQLHDEEWEAAPGQVLPVAKKKHHCTCLWATRQVQAQTRQWTQLPFDLVELRSCAYQHVLFNFAKLRFHSIGLKRGSLVLPGATIHFLRTCIDIACATPSDPSLRLAILIMTDSVGKKGYQYTIKYLWERFIMSNCVAALRIMTEILLEASHFDNLIAVWQVIVPIAKCIEHKSLISEVSRESTRIIFGAFIYILAGRKIYATTFHKADCPIHYYIEFVRCVELVKKYFSIDNIWKSPHMSSWEYQSLLNYLQVLRVFPFIESSTQETPEKHWAFPEISSARKAHQRMGPHIVSPDLFSRLQSSNKLDEVKASNAFIMDHLNDDVLRGVFSYLSYKPLASASRTCRSWHTLITDECIWENVYRNRYFLLGTAAQVQQVISRVGSWKKLFREKLEAQRELRFQRNPSTGWKHQTCNFCGCLKVLKSPKAMEKHKHVHNKVSTKRKAVSPVKVSVTRIPSKKIKGANVDDSLPTDVLAAMELYLAQSR